MGTRYYIHVGDATTSNGVVLTGLDSVQWHGFALSFEGDSVFCKSCNSIGHIKCIDDRVSSTGPHGREQALSGDLCICRCANPPRLLHSQTTAGTWSRTLAGQAAAGAAIDYGEFAGQSIQFGARATHGEDAYDQRFLVLDEATNEPVKDRRYKLIFADGELQGRTNAEGYTDCVSGRAGGSVSIEVLAEGA